MTTLHALILGVLQGLTEFLPVSSSGHLVLAELLLNLRITPADMLGYNILLHAGTLAALVVCYWREWWRLLYSPWSGDGSRQRMMMLIIVATLPGGIAGVAFEEAIAERFQSSMTVGLSFLGTAAILLFGEYSVGGEKGIWYRLLHPFGAVRGEPSLSSALFIGCAQALALLPGLSRSGLTITAGRMMGQSRRDALDFSFLMAVPIIAGAILFSLLEAAKGHVALPPFPVSALGVLASFVAGIIAILFLRRFVARHSMVWFVPYLVVLGVATVVVGDGFRLVIL